ncbi:Kinesin- motor protein, partial [Tilletia horrida]
MARTPEHKRVKTDAESRARGQAARRTQTAASRGGSASNATSLLGKRRADPEEPAGSAPAKRRAPTGSSGQVVDNQSTMTSLLGKRRADPDDAVDSHNTKRRVPASSSRKVLHNQLSIKDASTAAPTLLTSASTTQSRRPADTTSANIQVAVRVRGESWIDSPPAAECCLITEGARSDTLAVYTEPGAGILTAPPTSSLLPFASPIKPSRGKGAAAASDGVATSGKGKAKADSTDVSSRRTYNFDHVFGPEADQNMVYQDVAAPIISDVLDGYNCTIFCYGQTGTGKTHTMEGDLSPHPSSGTFASGAGIIPRTLFRIFHQLEQSGAEFSVRVTYVELYNEEARDLLADEDLNATTAADESDVSATKKTKPGAQVKAGKGGKSQASSSSSNNNKAGIRILNDSKTGVKLEGVEEVPITSAEHGLNILRRGSAKRQVASTNCNSQSSRSHSIFTLTIHHTTTTNLSSSQSGPAPGGPSATRPPVLGADGQPVNTAASGQSGEDVFRIGKLNLVDLAGSENIGRSGAAERQAKEAGMINQSLLTLGRVINALVEKQSHIPYRESKLTRLLQESLGGRTKTCIIATVSELRSSMDETLSTLEYATRARSIQTRPEINARTTRTALLSEYIAENLRLREDLKVTRSRNGVYLSPEQMQKMDQDYANAVTEKDKIKAQYDLAKSENQSVQEQLEQNSAVLARKEEEARAAKAEVERLRKLNSNLQSDLDEAVERRKEAEEQRRSYQRNGQTLNH